jgi:membrane associated rhomboid family serine protease
MTLTDSDWVEIGRFDSPEAVRDNALVLAAAGISSSVLARDERFGLAVSAADAARAVAELAAFRRENAARRAAPHGIYHPSQLTAAMAYAAVLAFFFVASGRQFLGFDWLFNGAASAASITGGELWRTVTALTLHADLGHIASNVIAGGILGILLAQVLGIGVAWLAILAAGALGNFVNAFIQTDGFAAIGASTAVFGGLGLLAAIAWRRSREGWRGLRAWAPLGAGAMLLAFMGMGGDSPERIDIVGHATGFAAGAALGAFLYRGRLAGMAGPRLQRAAGAAALAAILAAWGLAFAFA